MTELMKRYEAETDEIATWSWHNKEFVTDDVLDWASEKIQALDVENTQLKAQLTWRPVSASLNNVSPQELFLAITFEGNLELVTSVQLLKPCSGYVSYLPIPPAPEE